MILWSASKINEGTDVNFGELTRKMAKNIEQHPNANVQYNHEVIDFNHRKDGKWEVKVRQRNAVMFKLNLLIMYLLVLVVVLFHYYKNWNSRK